MIILIIGILLALDVWLLSFSPRAPVPLRLAGQVYLLIALLLAFRYWPPMIRWFTAMPVIHRTVFLTLIGAMAMGHYTLNRTTFYPYITWEIFPLVNEENPVAVPEFVGTTASGRKVRLLVEQLFPSIIQFYPPNEPDKLEHLVAAMARVYNRQHAGDPVQYVDLMMMAVELHPPADQTRTAPTCKLLNRYDVSSAR